MSSYEDMTKKRLFLFHKNFWLLSWRQALGNTFQDYLSISKVSGKVDILGSIRMLTVHNDCLWNCRVLAFPIWCKATEYESWWSKKIEIDCFQRPIFHKIIALIGPAGCPGSISGRGGLRGHSLWTARMYSSSLKRFI